MIETPNEHDDEQTEVVSATIYRKRILGSYRDGTPYEFTFYQKDGGWVDSPPELWGDQGVS